MSDPVIPYERSEIEFEAIEPNDPWKSPICIHCGREKGMHWQTADCRVWCLNPVAPQTGEQK